MPSMKSDEFSKNLGRSVCQVFIFSIKTYEFKIDEAVNAEGFHHVDENR